MELDRRRGWTLVARGGRASVYRADGARARLLGLAWLDGLPAGTALLIPRCRSVHTFGMRFALDVVFLDRDGNALRVARGVPPGRFRSCRQAASVLEAPAGVLAV